MATYLIMIVSKLQLQLQLLEILFEKIATHARTGTYVHTSFVARLLF